MSAGLRMFAGVPIWRTVAAQSNAACLTSAQVNPLRADLDAFLTLHPLRMFHRSDDIDMRTALVRHFMEAGQPFAVR